ncbi:MAG TPA: CAAX prenyl protease-related protein [Tepidisphaeraceae bacterium]|nr:CAAX prenyl protease-related protein [Tepidisphaeraceae bacterium]
MPDAASPTTKGPRQSPVRDDLAYMLPMGTFLLLIMAGGWLGTETDAGNTAYPWAYAARALIVAVMLWLFWPAYTRIRWDYWWLGLVVGVVGIFQWVGMQLWLQNNFEVFRPSGVAFNPDAFFKDDVSRWLFIAVRIFGAVLVVPVMEELFWRDFCWRSVIAPNDFKLAEVGEWDWKAFVVVPVIFSFVHLNWLLTSIVWAFMVGGLLAYTRSLGACIVAHATTNLLLAVYVLRTKQWFFW